MKWRQARPLKRKKGERKERLITFAWYLMSLCPLCATKIDWTYYTECMPITSSCLSHIQVVNYTPVLHLQITRHVYVSRQVEWKTGGFQPQMGYHIFDTKSEAPRWNQQGWYLCSRLGLVHLRTHLQLHISVHSLISTSFYHYQLSSCTCHHNVKGALQHILWW